MSSDLPLPDHPVVDHHVHLQLIDTTALRHPGSGLDRVVDLGAGPALTAEVTTGWSVEVDRVGQFLTAPGGYPSDRSWAPVGSVRELLDVEHARRAVADQAAAGATAIKVTLHVTAGPVPDVDTLRAVVKAAAPLPVVAHAEGPGMVELALAAGCDALAHTPFTEHLDDALVVRAAHRQKWISTLAIHRGTPALAVALDNLTRFHAAGGVVLYGTDLGNGDLPVGVNRHELELLAEAGLDAAARERACRHPWPG